MVSCKPNIILSFVRTTLYFTEADYGIISHSSTIHWLIGGHPKNSTDSNGFRVSHTPPHTRTDTYIHTIHTELFNFVYKPIQLLVIEVTVETDDQYHLNSKL